MTTDQTPATPEIEWPDEIWAEDREDGLSGIYRLSVFATVNEPLEHARYIHHRIHDSLKRYHAALIENGQLITRAVASDTRVVTVAQLERWIAYAEDGIVSAPIKEIRAVIGETKK